MVKKTELHKTEGRNTRMKDIKHRLKNKLKDNLELKKTVQARLASNIDGKLVMSTMHGVLKFYWIVNDKRVYINRHQQDLLRALTLKYYNTKVLKELEEQTKELKKALNIIDGLEEVPVPDYVYEKLQPEIKELVPKQDFTDEYVRSWQATKYARKPVAEEIPFYTAKNEHVRSKSELIIANMLNDCNVPYHYECPLKLGRRPISPDFIVLNKRTKEVFIWEHFGQMDNDEYNEKALLKIEDYIKNGYPLGKKLLVTFESSKVHLNVQLVSKIIAEYLL